MSTYALDPRIKEKVNIIQSGKWWVVELDDPHIAAQGESEQEALDKLKKRYEQYKDRRSPESKWTDRSDKRINQAQDVESTMIK